MKKLMRILLTGTAAILMLATSTGCSAKAKKAYHQHRADQFYAAGKFDRAEIEYLNVLRSDPQNSRAYGRLGEIYFDQGRLQRAVYFLKKGSQMDTNNLGLRLKMGFIYSAAGQFSEARDAANFVLDRNPKDDEAPLLLAEAAVKPAEMEAARQRLQNLARSGDRAAYEVALGKLAFRKLDLETAGAAFKRAQALDPKSSMVNVALGTLLWAQKDLAQAEACFKTAAELSPARSPNRIQYARFKVQTGDAAGARLILNDIVKQAPDYVPALMRLAEIAASEKKIDECADLLGKVLAGDPENIEAQLFDSQVKLMQNKSGEAVVELEKTVRMYPNVARVHYQLGLAYLAGDDTARGASSLEQAVKLDPNFTEAILSLAEIQIRNRNPNPATTSLEALLKKQPRLTQSQLLLADAYRLQGRLNEALGLYESLEKALPQNPQIPLLMGSTFLQQKDGDNARKEFSRVLEITPDNLFALEQLVNLDLSEKKFATASQRVQGAVDKNPQQVEPRLLIAKVFLAEGNRDQAEAALQKAIELAPENQTAYLLLAKIYYAAGKHPQALAKLNAALAKDPKDVSALMMTGLIYNDEKNYKEAASAYEKLLEVSPKFSLALNNLAYLYSENLDRLDRAYELAQRVWGLLPNDPSTADTLGWINFKRGAYSTALGLLQESVAKLPAEPEVQFHLGMACYMTGDEDSARAAFQAALQTGAAFPGRDECQRCLSILAINAQTADAAAQSVLEKRVASKADDPVAQRRLAAIYQREGKTDQAIAAREAVLRVNPKHLPSMVALAGLYKDPQKAGDMARAAYKLAPENPEVARVFGRLALQSGDYKLAAAVLQQAVQGLPDDAPTLFDFAQATFALGNVLPAREVLQNSLSHNLPAPQATEAARMVELLGLAASPAQAAGSLRAAEILKAEPAYVPALLAQAVAGEQRGDLPAAQLAYEKILNRYPDFAPAQKQLAAIYARDAGKADQAYALAIKARAIFPGDPALAKTLGIILVQKGDYTRAVGLLKSGAAGTSEDAERLFYLGTAQFRLKNRVESKASLQQALALKLSGQQATAARQMLDELKK